jgi:diguanylate cyclase (GGDEF)-like protein
VGESQPDHKVLAQILRSAGHDVQSWGLDEASKALDSSGCDIVIAEFTDLEQVLKILSGRSNASAPALLMLLDGHSPEKVVEMMKLGVGDCIPRPFHTDYTLLVVKRALEHNHLLKKAEEGERYKRISKLDSLTELYNHRHFHELISVELERAMRDHTPLSVLMIDVDKFKAYNDNNGHLAGDQALRQIASILRGSVRSYDIVARYGGEEFALMLPGTDHDRGMIVATRLARQVEAASFPHEDSMPDGRLTISIGVSSFPDFGRDKDSLIGNADMAMYAAKAKGGNAVCSATREKDVKATA